LVIVIFPLEVSGTAPTSEAVYAGFDDCRAQDGTEGILLVNATVPVSSGNVIILSLVEETSETRSVKPLALFALEYKRIRPGVEVEPSVNLP